VIPAGKKGPGLAHCKLKASPLVQGPPGSRGVREQGDAGDNRRTSVEWPASFTRRSNSEEPRHVGETRHGGQGDARRGIIPRFSMLWSCTAAVRLMRGVLSKRSCTPPANGTRAPSLTTLACAAGGKGDGWALATSSPSVMMRPPAPSWRSTWALGALPKTSPPATSRRWCSAKNRNYRRLRTHLYRA
jgi:hypothetical protein